MRASLIVVGVLLILPASALAGGDQDAFATSVNSAVKLNPLAGFEWLIDMVLTLAQIIGVLLGAGCLWRGIVAKRANTQHAFASIGPKQANDLCIAGSVILVAGIALRSVFWFLLGCARDAQLLDGLFR
jgi:hypothetical protein